MMHAAIKMMESTIEWNKEENLTEILEFVDVDKLPLTSWGLYVLMHPILTKSSQLFLYIDYKFAWIQLPYESQHSKYH